MASRFQTLDLLLQTLSTFWTEIYGGRDFIHDYLRGAAVQERQLEQFENEFFDSLGRLTCPTFHTDLWLSLPLVESDGQSANLFQYGEGFVYGVQDDGITYVYGQNEDTSWEFPIPSDLVSCSLVANSIVEPTVLLTDGVDFFIDKERAKIVFLTNPFLNRQITIEQENDENVVRMYLYNAKRDWQFVQKLYGSILKIPGRASENYTRLVNALLDSVSTASAQQQIVNVFSAVADIPLVRSATETVEVITETADELLIITDVDVYKFPLNSTVNVSVGSVVTKNQPLVTTVLIYEPNSGELPEFINQLSIGKGLLIPSISGELVFENKDVALTVTENVNGYTKITFALGGDSVAVNAFFTELHSRGVANENTLANYLDIRESPTQQPNASNLPATINPLRFLLENVLKYNTVFVYLRVSAFGENALGLDNLTYLRRIVPPHTAIILFSEVEVAEDEIELSADGSETTPGVSEEYETFSV